MKNENLGTALLPSQWLGVRCKEQGLLIPFEKMQAVCNVERITPLAHATPACVGLSFTRKQAVLVLDLLTLCLPSMDRTAPPPMRQDIYAGKLILLKNQGTITSGLWVDEILGSLMSDQFSTQRHAHAPNTLKTKVSINQQSPVNSCLIPPHLTWAELDIDQLVQSTQFNIIARRP